MRRPHRTGTRPSRRLTARGWTLLVIGLVLLGAGTFVAVADLVLLGAAATAVPIAAFAAQWRALPWVDIRRKVSPEAVAVGDLAEVEVSVRGKVPHDTLWVERRIDEFGGDLLAPPPNADGAEGVSLSYSVMPWARGRLRFGPLVAIRRDALGLAFARWSPELVPSGEPTGLPLSGAEIIVHPQSLPIDAVPRPSKTQLPVGARATRSREPHEDVSLRQYRQGDELRRVHWPTTARTGELMVRVDESGGGPSAMLFVALGGAPNAEAYENLISLTATVGADLLAQGYDVLSAAGEELREHVPGPRAEATLLDALALLPFYEAAGNTLRREKMPIRHEDITIAVMMADDSDAADFLVEQRGPRQDIVAVLVEQPSPKEASVGAAHVAEASVGAAHAMTALDTLGATTHSWSPST